MNQNQIFTKLVKRFPKDDLHNVVENWSPLNHPGLGSQQKNLLLQEAVGRTGKRKFISAVLKHFTKRNITDDELAELDLLFIQQLSSSRRWSMCKLNKIPDNPSDPVTSTPHTLQKMLKQELVTYGFKTVVQVKLKEDAFWIYINIMPGKQKFFSPLNSTCIMLHSKTVYLAFSNLKATFKKYISQALLNVFDGYSLDFLDLDGHCLRSLFHIVLNQQNPTAPFVDSGVAKKKSLKQSVGPSHLESDDADPRLEREDAGERQKRKVFVQNQFGEGSQPTLEKIEYTLETKFHGDDHAPNFIDTSTGIFRCKVKFEGTSVIEGLKNLASAGMAVLPMKKHLCGIRSLVKNKMVLKVKS